MQGPLKPSDLSRKCDRNFEIGLTFLQSIRGDQFWLKNLPCGGGGESQFRNFRQKGGFCDLSLDRFPQNNRFGKKRFILGLLLKKIKDPLEAFSSTLSQK